MAQAMVAITDVKLSKNTVQVKEQFKITVKVLALTPDSGKYRLPIRLGKGREDING